MSVLLGNSERTLRHLLDLEADEQRQIALEVEEGHLHDDRLVDVVSGDAPDGRHAAAVDAFFQHEAVDHHAGRELSLGHPVSFPW